MVVIFAVNEGRLCRDAGARKAFLYTWDHGHGAQNLGTALRIVSRPASLSDLVNKSGTTSFRRI